MDISEIKPDPPIDTTLFVSAERQKSIANRAAFGIDRFGVDSMNEIEYAIRESIELTIQSVRIYLSGYINVDREAIAVALTIMKERGELIIDEHQDDRGLEFEEYVDLVEQVITIMKKV